LKKTVMIFSLAALLLVSSGLSFSNSKQTREIRDIYFQKGERELLVFIEHSEGLTYESFTLFSPNRLVIDFANTERIASPGPFEVSAFGVKTIRTGKPNPYTSRVVFDLEDRIPRYKITDTDSGLRVSFWQEEEAAIVPQTKPAVEPQKPAVTEKRVEEKPAVKAPAPEKAERKVRTTSQATGTSNMGVGAYAGMYFMQDEVFQEAYGKMGLGFGGQYFFQLPLKAPSMVDFWLGFFTMSKTGAMTFTEEEIKFSLTQTSVAVRYNYKTNKFTLFVGPGIDYIIYKETLPEGFENNETNGSILGFHAQAGAMMDLLDSLAVHVFAKYNIAKATETIINTEEEYTVNLGGIQWGIGLIYRFNI
jgi:hypothetical protein